MRLRIARRGGLLVVVAIAALVAGALPASAAPGDGSAYGVRVDVKLLGVSAVQAGPLSAASTNGPTVGHLATVNVAGIVSTGVINTSAKRDDQTGAVSSDANTADVALPLLAAIGHVEAKAVDAHCTATQQGVSGSTSIVGADLGTLGAVAANPAPNSIIAVALPGIGNIATIILNEQIHNQDGSLTVNAIHLKLLGSGLVGTIGSGDVIISSATCGPAGLPIPMASGAGLWIGLGLLGLVAIPTGVTVVVRRRRGATIPA